MTVAERFEHGLEEQLHHTDPEARAIAAGFLASRPEAHVSHLLSDALQTEGDPGVRGALLGALAARRDTMSRELLTRVALEHRDPAVRQAALRHLAR